MSPERVTLDGRSPCTDSADLLGAVLRPGSETESGAHTQGRQVPPETARRCCRFGNRALADAACSPGMPHPATTAEGGSKRRPAARAGCVTPTPASRQHWGPGGHGNGQTLPLETVVSEGRRACLTRAPGRDFLGTMCNIPAEPLLLLTPCGGQEATAAGCPPGPARGPGGGRAPAAGAAAGFARAAEAAGRVSPLTVNAFHPRSQAGARGVQAEGHTP